MIESTPLGVRIKVRVVPRSGRAGIAGERDGSLLVRLSSAPVEGAANDELVEVIARAFGVARRAVTIVNGEHSRRKLLEVTGLDAAAARALLHIEPDS